MTAALNDGSLSLFTLLSFSSVTLDGSQSFHAHMHLIRMFAKLFIILKWRLIFCPAHVH
jgi:hypothetical protein